MRKRIENKIESLETKQEEKSLNLIIAKERPDGTYINRETGEAIDKSDIPENSIILTVSDDTFATW
jgi:hypothetical protein